ncbi:GNAT family N-acetyltransferase [Arcanobacterium phocae]|uniref:N-acetyltransferase domain-containing protein n=1 Tax=Arcanobacterium phocae TaxID=131112 RepID=A0A1H2LKG1_9ACTO|nr:GNAT family N-acetyltransferase [Arcanobacterium phocae]SDU81342.1 hypothetical protein SAMN04489737_1488 [Arcanobacterium phocae]
MQHPETPPLRSRSFAERLGAPAVVRLPGPHLGLTWRELVRADLSAVVDLMSSLTESPFGFAPPSSRTVSHWFDEITAQPGTYDVLSGWDQHGKLQAVATVLVNDKPLSELQAEVSAVVRPDWVGRGIGRSLLEWQDDRARQLMSQYPSDLPVSIRALVTEKNAGRRRLLAAGGYAPISYITHVSTKISDRYRDVSLKARERLGTQGFQLESYNPSVDTELRKLHNRLILELERYQPISVPAWQAKLSRADHDFSLLLIKDHQLVGYMLAEQIPEVSALRIYYYGIERALRRNGIGTDLMLSVLGFAHDAGITTVAVPVVSRYEQIPQSLVSAGFEFAHREIVYSIDI